MSSQNEWAAYLRVKAAGGHSLYPIVLRDVAAELDWLTAEIERLRGELRKAKEEDHG